MLAGYGGLPRLPDGVGAYDVPMHGVRQGTEDDGAHGALNRSIFVNSRASGGTAGHDDAVTDGTGNGRAFGKGR